MTRSLCACTHLEFCQTLPFDPAQALFPNDCCMASTSINRRGKNGNALERKHAAASRRTPVVAATRGADEGRLRSGYSCLHGQCHEAEAWIAMFQMSFAFIRSLSEVFPALIEYRRWMAIASVQLFVISNGVRKQLFRRRGRMPTRNAGLCFL